MTLTIVRMILILLAAVTFFCWSTSRHNRGWRDWLAGSVGCLFLVVGVSEFFFMPMHALVMANSLLGNHVIPARLQWLVLGSLFLGPVSFLFAWMIKQDLTPALPQRRINAKDSDLGSFVVTESEDQSPWTLYTLIELPLFVGTTIAGIILSAAAYLGVEAIYLGAKESSLVAQLFWTGWPLAVSWPVAEIIRFTTLRLLRWLRLQIAQLKKRLTTKKELPPAAKPVVEQVP